MAPILIDNRGLIKLGLIFLLTVLVVFSAGYFSGYQKASVLHTFANKIENLELPEPTLVNTRNTEAQRLDVFVAGEEIDVDQPVLSAITDELNQSNRKNITVNKTAESSMSLPKASIEIDSLLSKNSTQVAQQALLESVQTSIASIDNRSNHTKKIDVSILTNDELNKIKYSIQVGTYGNLNNAENMVIKLQEKQFDAYVADYNNKKNEIRYNVRFGYFSDKKTAVTSLKRYKNIEKGDGYLVNFSIDNIVNLADKNTIKSRVKPASPIHIIDESKPVETNSSEMIHNKLIQEKYLDRKSVV